MGMATIDSTNLSEIDTSTITVSGLAAALERANHVLLDGAVAWVPLTRNLVWTADLVFRMRSALRDGDWRKVRQARMAQHMRRAGGLSILLCRWRRYYVSRRLLRANTWSMMRRTRWACRQLSLRAGVACERRATFMCVCVCAVACGV